MINELRKRREAVGGYPNPYPNGWFRILDSAQLLPQESKEVNVLGKLF